MASSSARNEPRPVWALGFPGTLGTALSITAFWERPVRVRSSGLGPKGGPWLCWAARKAPAAAAAAAVALVPGASGSPPGGTRLGDPPLLSGSRPPGPTAAGCHLPWVGRAGDSGVLWSLTARIRAGEGFGEAG